MDHDVGLAIPARLAVAYVPAIYRPAFTLLLQIDERLAGILKSAREPMIAQIKMAWWREAFGNAPHLRPKGEPLLQLLNDSNDVIPPAALDALVSAWEMLLGQNSWDQQVTNGHADLRAEAIFQTYARWVGSTQDVQPVGRAWALADLRQAFPERVAQGVRPDHVSLPSSRKLRPLSILTMSTRTRSGPRLVLHALTGR